MRAYRDGRRKSSVGNSIMIPLSKAATDDEMRTAAEYYASLKLKPWLRIVETDTVPATYVGLGNMRFETTDGKKEPIGRRIIELPEDAEKAELREECARQFPDKLDLYDMIYESRFQRLWEQFRD